MTEQEQQTGTQQAAAEEAAAESATQSASAPGEEAAAEFATQSASGPVEEAVVEETPAPDIAAQAEAEAAVPEADAGASAEPEATAESQAPAEPDFRDQYLRAAADLENVRKRARRDVAVAESRGIARLAKELLPALDDFDRALAAAEAQPENRDHHLTDGIRLVQSRLLAALKRVGIEPEAPKGEKFDPHRHEALAQQPVDGAETGTIVEVYSPGYRYGDDVLRAAKVVVAA
jgi:molecular chaperone GrpE